MEVMLIERIPGPLAPVYEKAARMVIETYYRPVADELVSRFQTGLILDAGTGPGYLPIEIVRRRENARVVGIDLSRQLVQRARRNAAAAGVADRLHFLVAHAASAPFAAGRFDVLISTGMLHSLRDPPGFFEEVRRVLKKGGEAFIYDPARVSGHIDIDRWKRTLTLRERFWLWLFKRLGIHTPARPLQKQQVEAILAQIDFAEVDIEATGDDIRIRLRK